MHSFKLKTINAMPKDKKPMLHTITKYIRGIQITLYTYAKSKAAAARAFDVEYHHLREFGMMPGFNLPIPKNGEVYAKKGMGGEIRMMFPFADGQLIKFENLVLMVDYYRKRFPTHRDADMFNENIQDIHDITNTDDFKLLAGEMIEYEMV